MILPVFSIHEIAMLGHKLSGRDIDEWSLKWPSNVVPPVLPYLSQMFTAIRFLLPYVCFAMVHASNHLLWSRLVSFHLQDRVFTAMERSGRQYDT